MKYNILSALSFVFILHFSCIAQTSGLGSYFDLEGEVFLEEKEESILVTPIYHVDNDGNIIIADLRQNEIKIFDEDGNFINSFGQTGRGPGEFTNLISVSRMSNGKIVAADVSGRLTVFSNNGSKVIESFDSGIIPLTGVKEVGSGQLVLFGRGSRDDDTYLLHLLDIESGEREVSFLEFSFADYSQILQMLPNISTANVDDEDIVAFKSPIPEINFFNTESLDSQKIRINGLEHFKFIEEQDINENNLSLIDLTKFSWIDQVYMTRDGRILIQYVRWLNMPPPGANEWRESEYSIALIDRNGDVHFEIQNTPKLVGYNKDKEKFYFIDVNREEEEYKIRNLKIAKLTRD